MRYIFTIIFVLFFNIYAFGALTNPPTATENQYLTFNNELSNGGFEGGKTGWSSAITVITTTGNVKKGVRAGEWDPSGSGTISSPCWTTKQDTAVNGLARLWVKTADADYDFQVYNSTGAVVVAEVDVPASSDLFTQVQINFPAAESTTYCMRLEAQGDESVIYLDDGYLGEAYNLSQVSQAYLYGTVKYTGVTSCQWVTSSTSFANFSADSDCNNAVATGRVAVPGSKIPGLTLSGPAGSYMFISKGSHFMSTTGNAGFRFSDGTNVTNVNGMNNQSSAVNAATLGSVLGTITYASPPSNVLVQLQAYTSASNAGIQNSSTPNFDLEIEVWYYPSGSSIATNIDTAAYIAYGIISGTAAQNLSSSASYIDLDNANLTLTQGAYSAPVSIACASTNPPGTTTCPSSSESVGFAPTIITPGLYEACFNYSLEANAASSAIPLANTSLCETSTTSDTCIQQAQLQQRGIEAITSGTTTSIGASGQSCGYLYLSKGQKVIRWIYTYNGGSNDVRLVLGATTNPNVSFSLKPMFVNYPMPQILNQVSTNYSAGFNVNVAKLDCDGASTITSQLGSWVLSIGNISSGACLVTFTGAMPSAPYCFITESLVGNGRILAAINASTTTVSLQCTNDAGANCSDFDASLMCVGAK